MILRFLWVIQHQLLRGWRSLTLFLFTCQLFWSLKKKKKQYCQDSKLTFILSIHMEVKSRHTAAVLLRDPVFGWRTFSLAVETVISLSNTCETMTRGIRIMASVIFAIQLVAQQIHFIFKCYYVLSISPIYYLSECTKCL